MGKLVRIINGEVAIAQRYVATPTYTLYTADYVGGAVPPYGWVYYPDEVTHEDFAPIWKQPVSSLDSYKLGDIVQHNNLRWRSSIDGNVWEPGISGWQDASTDIPAWIQPTGAHDAYSKNVVVRHNGNIWTSLLDANVWEPGIAEWRKTAMVAPGEPTAYPSWVQPTGAGDAYPLNAIVTHNGHTWRSDYAANVWEPGVFGWTQI